MNRFVDRNDKMQRQEQSDVEEEPSSLELLTWRKESSTSPTARFFSKNQNSIGHQHSQDEQKKNPQSFTPSSSSINFTTDHPVELCINANNETAKTDSNVSVIITRRSSKPSRHESVQKATSQTRKRQRDRYINHHHRLQENQLYSLNVSSNSIECNGTNCQPSVFNASYRCRTIISENDIDAMIKFPLLNDQDIKQNMSYVSLTNLSDLIDHEPNVSRRDSYSRSTSSILMHKPSLFLADVFNKMTHEQRAKSIAQLVQFHENLIQSSSTIDKLQKATSLPNLNNKLTKLHSVPSLLSEITVANNIRMDTKISSSSSIEQKPIGQGMPSEHLSKSPDEKLIASPIKLGSVPEHKVSDENIHTNVPSVSTPATSSPITVSPMIKPSPILIKSNKSNTSTDSGKRKISRSNHFLDADLHEQSSRGRLKPFKTERINTQSSNISNSMMDSPSIQKQRSDNETKLENNNDSISKTSIKQNMKKFYSKNDMNQPLKVSSSSNKAIDQTSQSKVLVPSIINKEKQMPSSSSPHFQSSNDENSLNDVTDHLSQQDMTISNTNPDKSMSIPSKESKKVKQALSLLQAIDEVSQQSKSSHSDLKNSPLLINGKKTLSTLPIKPELTPLLPIDDADTSLITRATTASTNLTITNDGDDDQSKLINEQLKRSSLGLARDSLELLRNTTPHHPSNDEQITPHTNIDSTPHKRKSVLKSHLDSSDHLPTPNLISYVAIDEVKDDKHLLEEQMRRRSLTIGGGTVISCISPKPKRDSLTLLQERYSGSSTPHSGYYHLSNSESKHVEFIREPGDTITPVLHIGRETKVKHSSHTSDASERTKSDTSIIDSQQRLEIETRPRRASLDSISRHRTPQKLLTTTSSARANDIEHEKVYFTQNDYDEMLRLMMTPLSKTKKRYSIKSNIELSINHRLTTFQNLILVILLISFYIFVFIKSQYWQEHN